MADEVRVFANGARVFCRGQEAVVTGSNAPSDWYPAPGETVDVRFVGMRYRDPRGPRYYTAHWSELEEIA